MIDSVNTSGLETIDGGTGSDTIDLSSATGAVWLDLTWVGIQVWTSGGAIATGANANTALAKLTGIENIIGTGGSDMVWGNAEANRYTYTGHFGTTADRFFGRDGADTIDMSALGASGAGVWVDLALAGTNVWTSGTAIATGANANTEVMLADSVENVIGTRVRDEIYGTAGNNTYFMNGNFAAATGQTPGPADFFDGRGGTDTIDFSLFGQLARSIWIHLGFTSDVEAWTSGLDSSTTANANIRVADVLSVENVVGTRNSDTIFGNALANRLDGFGGSGAGPETINGGAGNDTYVFKRGYLSTSIESFVAGGTDDAIEISGMGTAFDSFNEVMNVATDVGGNVVINFLNSDVLTLVGVVKANLTAADFIFV